ncbi:MAG: amino acid ABC transporter permease [Proteobacteria bacterium]|nr:amino acid ABC transporter permease [Pseudomonadota bacterium]
MSRVSGRDRPQISLLFDPKVRSVIYQAVLLGLVGLVVYAAASNAIDNLARAKIASGFAFWNHTAGFEISQTLIAYSSQSSTYGRAFWVGLLNTLLVAGLGIAFATIIGFIVGIARLSSNWLVARLAGFYVESVRILPLLLQLLFWYNAVLKALPELRDSVVLPFGGYLNNRGLFLPRLDVAPGFDLVLAALVIAGIGAVALRLFSRVHQRRTGRRLPVVTVTLVLILTIPALVFLAAGAPVTVRYPQVGRFNISGGIEILPEFVALLVGLSIYTAAFIAEVVRAGIVAVSRGQMEAAQALGLRRGLALRLVVIPQAMRVIIPPLTNQYLNLTKNSSLAVAIGYPDFVQIFTGTVLNQTGQAIEVVALTMAVYLTISLGTSFLLNLYNARVALVER